MFSAQPTLRINGQSSYQTTFGGCLSILLVLSFIVIFSRSFINVLNKVNVTATLNIEDNPYDDSKISGIRMAIGIQGLDFSETQRYLHIILKVKTSPLRGAPIQVQIPLKSCELSEWKDLGDHFEQLFSVYSMSKMLCPFVDQNLTLKGFGGSEQWVTMNVNVQQCRNGTSTKWTCYSPIDIANKFISQQAQSDFFKMNFLVMNTVISPQQDNPTKIVLQNQIFVTFSNTSGSRCQLKLGRYQITTDNSIWPVTDDQTISGYYITSHETYSINLYSTHYVRIQIQKARTIYNVTRSHDKLDSMLSYVGGLFALLFGWIYFFIGSYNLYKYEIAVAQHGFALDKTGRKIRQDEFGFWTYFKYSLFDWIKSLGMPTCWPNMQQIDAARSQATQQMDVCYLMKKIQRFEAINKFLLGQHNMIYANLCRPPTLDQVKRLRKITQYYDKVIKIEIEEHLLKQTLQSNMSKKKVLVENFKQEQQAKLQIINESIQLDSEDKQIQRQIAQIFKNHKQMKDDELTMKILQQIPISMKNRLQNLNIEKKGDESKFQFKIQSTFALNQSSATPMITQLFAGNAIINK